MTTRVLETLASNDNQFEIPTHSRIRELEAITRHAGAVIFNSPSRVTIENERTTRC